MKAIICTKYGSPDVLQYREVGKPVPQEDEVLIQNHAASLNSRDFYMLRANPLLMRLMPRCFFRSKNKILGADLVRRVEAIGHKVKQIQPVRIVIGEELSASEVVRWENFVNR